MSKKRNLRECPAVKRRITSRDCGEKRNSKYQCPLDCVHNPFHADNYDQFLNIESRVDEATVRYANKDPLVFQRTDAIFREYSGKDMEITGGLASAFFREVGEDGLTFGERWEKKGFPGLKNDDRVALKCKKQVTAVLLEVQVVVDEHSVVCLNLIGDPRERITVYDRSFAAIACRFQHVFALAYPTPGYWRLLGTLVELKNFDEIGIQAGFEAIVTHLGGESDEDWLTRNFVKVAQSILAVGRERHRLKLQKTDFSLVRVDYELGEFEDQFAKRLIKAGCIEDEVKPVESDDGFELAFIWPDRISKDAMTTSMGGTPYLGSVLLKPGAVRLEAARADLIEALRKAFEKVAGNKVRFVRELVEDIAAQKSMKIDGSDLSLVPPALLQNVSGTQVSSSLVDDAPDSEEEKSRSIQSYLETYYRKILEEPLPQLDGLTPIQAAQDLVARPKLIEWAKSLVRSADYQSLQMGEDIDVNWLLKELNLGEIDFPPPPKRRPIASPYIDEAFDDFGDGEQDDLNDVVDYWGDLIFKRIEEYGTAAMALDEMKSSGFDLVDDFFELTGGLIDEKTYDLFIPMLIMVWAAIVPKGTKVSLSKAQCDRSINDALQNIQSMADQGFSDIAMEVQNFCREPELFIFLSIRFEDTVRSLPKKQQPREETLGGVMIALIAAINVTLDAVGGHQRLF